MFGLRNEFQPLAYLISAILLLLLYYEAFSVNKYFYFTLPTLQNLRILRNSFAPKHNQTLTEQFTADRLKIAYTAACISCDARNLIRRLAQN